MDDLPLFSYIIKFWLGSVHFKAQGSGARNRRNFTSISWDIPWSAWSTFTKKNGWKASPCEFFMGKSTICYGKIHHL